jgi:hypothetical protein
LSAIFAASAMRGLNACGLAADLPQDATLYREDEVIDECLKAVAPVCLEVFGGQTKRRMRALFNGIQIRRNRLKGVSQSSQIGAGFGIHSRHH